MRSRGLGIPLSVTCNDEEEPFYDGGNRVCLC